MQSSHLAKVHAEDIAPKSPDLGVAEKPKNKTLIPMMSSGVLGQGLQSIASGGFGIKNDYAYLPFDESRILLQAPEVSIIRTAVIKDRPKDVILHTLKLVYRGWIWYVPIRRTALRNVYNSLASTEYKARGKKFKISAPKMSSGSSKKLNKISNREQSVVESFGGGGEPVSMRSNSYGNGRGGSRFEGGGRSTRANMSDKNFSINDKTNRPFVHRFERYRKILSRKMYRVDEDSIRYQKEVIISYFRDVLEDLELRNHPDLLEMLELSPKSFDSNMGPSFKEGYLKARCSADTQDRLFKTDADRALCGNFCGEAGGLNCCCCVCFCFRKKATIKRRSRLWGIIKNSSISFYNERSCKKLVDVVMFQPSTVVSDQLVSTGSKNGVVIVDSAWMAEIKLDSNVQQKQWVAVVKSAIVRCPWVERERFKYTPRYSGSLLTHGSMSSLAQWFITPEDLWISIHDSLLNAKEEVFLAGWWISPEIYLKRPGHKFPNGRLDKVIETIAKRGVKVYILQFKEPKVMPMDSMWTRECFLSKNPVGKKNIQYLRHGDISFPYMWSHHEKLVVIDQDIAFAGGVDLSLGRWDTPEYKLRDDGPVEKQLWRGKDYQNPRLRDYVDVRHAMDENPVTGTNRAATPRMPRRDIHMRVFGQTALDISWHFVQRWNYNQNKGVKKGRFSTFTKSVFGVNSTNSDVLDDKVANVDGGAVSQRRGSVSVILETKPGTEAAAAANASKRRPSMMASAMRRLSISQSSPTSGRGDGGGGGDEGGGIVKPDSVSDEQWNSMSTTKRRSSIMSSTIELNGQQVKVEDLQNPEERVVMPFKFDDDDEAATASRNRMVKAVGDGVVHSNRSMNGVTQQDADFLPSLEAPREPVSARKMSVLHKISVLGQKMNRRQHNVLARRRSTRGASPRMGDLQEVDELGEGSEGEGSEGEGSNEEGEDEELDYGTLLGSAYKPNSTCTGKIYPGIADAYKHFIENAQHTIYIENQFFVSGMRGNGRVSNTLAQSLYSRIMKAAVNKSKFRVLILIPLLPAMEGPVKGGPLSSIAGVMYWQFRSICRGGGSLLEMLEEGGVDPSEYIKFVGLRTHEQMSTGWQTEMVYIHSKLMIVDDRVTIIGSANFNDRSMLGHKDSEICVLTEDTKMVDSKMGGQAYKAGKFSKSLRMKAWSEFCGIDPEDEEAMKILEDPSCDECWDYLTKLAADNTSKYEKVFKDLVPSNRIKKGDDLHGTGASSGTIKDSSVSFRKRMSVSAAAVPGDGAMGLPGLSTGGLGGRDGHSHVPADREVNRSPSGLRGGGGSMRGSTHSQDQAKKAVNLLNSVQGLLVEWPLDFMSEDFKHLHPTALPGEIFK
ncbi:hypothetical protein TL16_g07117 [Triparma laevis f. inornata]|uniref:Phospholipase n=1 Tax=Triparma laevis f. inornata TaxID=1714386 RepID=A0A9W7AW23_9STRA|nr:hypothetical protein TL16_g07117 [Triparma laevis f. inornata]